MKILDKYQPKHYHKYIDKVDDFFCSNYSQYNSIDTWVKTLSTKNVLLLNKSMKHLLNDQIYYFNESAIIVTLLIRLFMLELDVKYESITLKNSEIEKLIARFNLIIKNEIDIRKHNDYDFTHESYTLLKDTEYERLVALTT